MVVDTAVGDTIRIFRMLRRLTQLDLSKASGQTAARIRSSVLGWDVVMKERKSR